MNTMKKRGCQILVLFMTAGMLTGCGDGTPKLEDALKKTASYEMKTVEDPASDALGGEWTVMALARSGEEVDENYIKTGNLVNVDVYELTFNEEFLPFTKNDLVRCKSL